MQKRYSPKCWYTLLVKLLMPSMLTCAGRDTSSVWCVIILSVLVTSFTVSSVDLVSPTREAIISVRTCNAVSMLEHRNRFTTDFYLSDLFLFHGYVQRNRIR